MVYPPGQDIDVRNDGVGLIASGKALPVVVGVTSKGTADTLYQYTDPNTLKAALGHGPAVGLALAVMPQAGGVLVLKTGGSTAGAAGSVTPVRVGTSSGTVTVAGAPHNAYEVIVEITADGTLGAGKFKYSLDDDRTYSPELTIPAGGTYAIPDTNLTLTFVPGAGPDFYDNGDTHSFDCTVPHYTTTDLGTAWTALLDQIGSRKIRQCFFSGQNATAADGATMAAAIATHMGTLETNFYYARAVMDAGDDTVANVLSSFSAFADDRVCVCYGTADVITHDSHTGYGTPNVPIAHVVAERAARADLSENLGRKQSGPLRGVLSVTHDEGKDTAFSEADKLTTLRTYRGESGFYITNGYLRSPVGSDFLYYDWGRTIDEVCEIVHTRQQKWLLSKFRSKTDGSGNLDGRDAARVETFVKQALRAKLLDPINIEGFKGHVSGLSYTVDQTNDYLATRTLRSQAGAVPLSPAETIETQIGFVRSVE